VRPPAAGLRPAVFLDRDGVLNEVRVRGGVPLPPEGLEDLEIVPDAALACQELRAAGFFLCVVTNQPDLARGSQSQEVVDAIHARLTREVEVDDLRVCPHDDADRCGCRKPRPGLLLAAAAEHGLDLERSFMVGDRWRDVDAGHRAGCRAVLIDRGYREPRRAQPDAVVATTLEAARWILAARTPIGGLARG